MGSSIHGDFQWQRYIRVMPLPSLRNHHKSSAANTKACQTPHWQRALRHSTCCTGTSALFWAEESGQPYLPTNRRVGELSQSASGRSCAYSETSPDPCCIQDFGVCQKHMTGSGAGCGTPALRKCTSSSRDIAIKMYQIQSSYEHAKHIFSFSQ